MQYEFLRCEISNSIATVVIDRPPANALCAHAWGELSQLFYDLGQDDAVKSIILTADHEKLFVGGSDVTEFLTLDSESGCRYTLRNNAVRFSVYECPKPVICALNGAAYGGGLGLALMCDMRISVPNAKFAVGEINMGILGFTQFLALRVHSGTARRMVYSGLPVDAQTALRIGLIDEIVEPEELLPRCMELAQRFAAQSPIALRRAKECMLRAEDQIFAGQAFEDGKNSELWGTRDQKEAVQAFLEKRPPRFENR